MLASLPSLEVSLYRPPPHQFDRDYVEFNVRISDLETALRHFINSSFESITSIEQSLNLLRKFQTILQVCVCVCV